MIRIFIIGFLMVWFMETHCGAPQSFAGPFPASSVTADSLTVITVNGEPVSTGEFKMKSHSLRALVIHDYTTRNIEVSGAGFWLRSLEGKTPSGELKKRTMDTLVRVKIKQLCAKEAGLVKDVSYAGFLGALKYENDRRYKAKQDGEVIYGPVQYSGEVYYNYLLTNLEYRLKEYLADSVFLITEDALRTSYESDKDRLYSRGYSSRVGMIPLDRREDAANPELLKQMQKSETILVFNDTVRVPEEEDPEIRTARIISGKLSAGEYSRVVEVQGKFYMVRMQEKIHQGYRSFQSCMAAVRIQLVNRMYDRYIRDLVEEAKIVVNTDVYKALTFN